MTIVSVVEDDENIRNLILYSLNSKGYKSFGFENSKDFYKSLNDNIPNLLILDIMLPDEDGYSILSNLRLDEKYIHIPIIFLTAKTSEYDRIKGLDMGADDYVSKPFSVMELMSRVNAILRRYESNKTPESSGGDLVFEEILINDRKRKAYAQDKLLDLTYKEFELLKYLIVNRGIVLTRNNLMNEIWGFDFEGESRTIDVHIRSLRNKLGPYSSYIKTIRNVGYKIEV